MTPDTANIQAAPEPQVPSGGPSGRGPSDRTDSERGSALVMVMMVMVIMTILGLSFLVVSDTENQVAVNDRDARQVLYVAFAGAKMVEEWFNNPDSSTDNFLPAKTQCVLDQRVGDSNYDGTNDINVPVNGSSQRYRGGTGSGAYRLFDKPYRGATRDTFWGNRDTPDVLISDDPNTPNEFLDQLNTLWNPANSPSLQGIKISEIRLYAPPYDRTLQRRFGICTAEVTAAKVLVNGTKRKQVSTRTVRIVMQEMPFPGPGAAIESAGNIDLHGNFGVHWGGSYTQADTSLQSGSNFPGPSVPRENTSRFRWANFAPDAPDLDPATAGVQNLLTQLLTGPFQIPDAWLYFRTDGHFAEAPNTNDQPWPYNYSAGLSSDKSIFFQNQTYVFPVLDYDFWKRFVQTRAKNSYYFKYTGLGGGNEPQFARDGVGSSYSFAHWSNTETPGQKPGVYFFDTTNSLNPQNGGGGTLTPIITLNSGTVDSPSGNYIAEGLVFSNATTVDSSGISSKAVTRTVNMPAEPFLDTGVDINQDGSVGDTAEEVETIGNGIWDFCFDGDTQAEDYDTVYLNPAFQTFEQQEQFGSGVVPEAGHDPRVWADTVHEPYLNLAYPDPTHPKNPVTVDYDFELTTQRTQGGDRNKDNVTDRMTSLRDHWGAQVNLALSVNGIWYNEGQYNGSGNMTVYGSILMRGGFAATGTPDVYYNEAIGLGNWPPTTMQIPRVYISQEDTN